MSNIYKLQRFTNNSWVDVKIGQEIPSTDPTEVGSQLEEFLTLSQISGQFLSTQILAGDPNSNALYQMPYAYALGLTSVAFGSSFARGVSSTAFGGSGLSNGYIPPTMTPGLYWDGTQFYAPSLPGSLEALQQGMLQIVTNSFGTFRLVIDTISFDSDNAKYIFTFSQTLGDWSGFINIVDSITDTNKHITATVHYLTHSAAGSASLVSGVNCQTTSEASCAHTFGQGLIANSPAQTVIGSYNQKNSDAQFLIGGGTTDSVRKNIFEILQNGQMKLNCPVETYNVPTNRTTTTTNWQYLTCPLVNPNRWRGNHQILVTIDLGLYSTGETTGWCYDKQSYLVNTSSLDSGYMRIVLPINEVVSKQKDYIENKANGTGGYVHYIGGYGGSHGYHGLHTSYLFIDLYHNCIFLTYSDVTDHVLYLGARTSSYSCRVSCYFLN